ncbi:MAG TPA: acetoin utilization protein AcuC, partial [Rhodospirillales bacterium]|nr:acetoin utilization protein AcuC [Rhodospirillales bacterium]
MATVVPVMIASEIFRTSRHASGHPLAIPRVSLTVDVCRALGWLPVGGLIEAEAASVHELTRFHTADYVAAVQRTEATQTASPDDRVRFNLGVNGNPVYGEVFRRPATACGASLAAARRLRAGGVVYNPAGGTHHGQPDRASGYCIFNDPVLAILEMLDQGLHRVAYVDFDAHFGDGVQQAFHHESRVRTISVHEDGRWPMARGDGASDFGGEEDRGGGFARNLPVPEAFNDSELHWLVEHAIVPLISDFAPQAIVVQ